MIGNILGNRYRVLREIGSGGMAKVYLAEDIKSGELVAAKLLYPQFGEDISFVQRFNREAKLASTLTDPHIVRVLDYGADRDQHYLVMELVEGQDLYDQLQDKGYLEWRHALELIDQLATALEHAHAHGVVHRDIKPQNMMMDDSGMLKVLDFGIARIPTMPSLTQSGFIGSPYYASPEQAMGEEVDIRSDIYSSGVVLYELLSGNTPFDAKSPWSIISQHITSEPPPIVLSDGKVPDNVYSLLKKMLAKRPEERFQTPNDLRQAIAAVLANQPMPQTSGIKASEEQVDPQALIKSFRERAEKAMQNEEWMRAADLLGQAVKLNPDGLDLLQKLADVERKAQLQSLYKLGKRAIENNKWEEAINHFSVIVDLESENYEDVAFQLKEANKAFKLENEKRYIATRYQEGLSFFEAERWEEAIETFTEVKNLSPGYQEVTKYLAQAKSYNNPNITQQFKQLVDRYLGKDTWRWGLVAAGLVAIALLTFLAFGNNNQAAGDDDTRERLRVLYAEAQQSLDSGNDAQALFVLNQIFDENPDYADVADLRRELMATPTPLITADTPTPKNQPFFDMLSEAENALEVANWSTAIDTLTELRQSDPEFEPARVASLFCDAHVGRGLDILADITPQTDQTELISEALADFESGAAECPRRTDLQEQAERTAAYLTALETPDDDYDTLIRILTPIVAAAPNYASGQAKQALYQAYLGRGAQRERASETIAAALGDYEAALALSVDNPSQAQTKRAELLLSFAQRPPSLEAVPEETATAQAASTLTPVPTNAATPQQAPAPAAPVRIKYSKPTLISPLDDTVFAGEFAEVTVEWEPVGQLAPNEYYDLTIMHLFADEPNYAGSQRTTDTQIQLTRDIGVGEAGGDRFYWWVTVRKDNTAVTINGLDTAISPRSDARTFIWSP